MEPLGIAVVIPVLNEGASIAAVISEIPRDWCAKSSSSTAAAATVRRRSRRLPERG